MLWESDGRFLPLAAVSFILLSSFHNFKVSLSSDDGFISNKEYSEFVTNTMVVVMVVVICFYWIFLSLHEYVQDQDCVHHFDTEPGNTYHRFKRENVMDPLRTLADVLAPLTSWITWRPDVRIFRDTTILVGISYVILLDIHLSFAWLAIFPVMTILFIVALYFKFSPCTPESSNIAEKTKRKTGELTIIMMMSFVALLVMDYQLPDQAADGFAISQFLLFLSCTVAALTRMMKKLPAGASLPGLAPASEMLHKTLLLLLLVTANTVAAELLGEVVVLLCLPPQVISVLLWFSLHHDRKPSSVDKMKLPKMSPVLLGALLAPLIAYAAIHKDEFGLSSSFLVPCGVSGILTSYIVFMLSQWPRQHAAAAGKDGSSGILK